jgi:pimeloyl-ACP methyl ester carboxylesterase
LVLIGNLDWLSSPELPLYRPSRALQKAALQKFGDNDEGAAHPVMPHSSMTQPILHASDLRGLASLSTDAMIGLTGLVEAMHARIASPPRLPVPFGGTEASERTRGITGFVYRSVGGVTQLVGASVQSLLGLLAPLLTPADPSEPDRAERQAVLAALNGVLGDHLAATRNPLAIRMAFHHAGVTLAPDKASLRKHLPHASPKPLVLIHGLCMSPAQWRRGGHDHGEALARERGYTPVYLQYNSGLSIATNGRLFAAQLQQLVESWPVPIERLVLLGHSMGGLVARSALHHGMPTQKDGAGGSCFVNDLVCLGSPHQGAPLERAGHGIDLVLSAAPYAAPLARLGKVRSAGIRDLRRGHITDLPSESHHPPHHPHPAQPSLPDTVRAYAVAGCLGPSRHHLKARALGDGLVPVDSALGHHAKPERRVHFDPKRQFVVQDTGHLDLLSSPVVFEQLKAWLS